MTSLQLSLEAPDAFLRALDETRPRVRWHV